MHHQLGCNRCEAAAAALEGVYVSCALIPAFLELQMMDEIHDQAVNIFCHGHVLLALSLPSLYSKGRVHPVLHTHASPSHKTVRSKCPQPLSAVAMASVVIQNPVCSQKPHRCAHGAV